MKKVTRWCNVYGVIRARGAHEHMVCGGSYRSATDAKRHHIKGFLKYLGPLKVQLPVFK
jgi:hypothetical protein